MLYIVLFLHQTTTLARRASVASRCISYYSYIKPQPWKKDLYTISVVYRTIPTSNHNIKAILNSEKGLYIVLFLHQTTTLTHNALSVACCISYYSYIKPQPLNSPTASRQSCISYYSYIKPQRRICPRMIPMVVYRTIPTSNHNYPPDGWVLMRCISYYSYIKPQLVVS